MEHICTLIAVRDIEKAKQFYMSVLGLEVISDFGVNVILTGGISLQTIETWKNFIGKTEDEIILGSSAYELYFEEDDLDAFAAKLAQFDHIKYVHPMLEHSWGQRVIRFYDRDQHIIEVGESIHNVIRRFLDSGLTLQETAARMDVPLSYIENHIDSNAVKSNSLNQYIQE